MIENVSSFENYVVIQNNYESNKLRLEEDIKTFSGKAKNVETNIYVKEQKKNQIEALIADKEVKRKLKELEDYEKKLEKVLNTRDELVLNKGKYEENVKREKEEVLNAEDNLKFREKTKKLFMGYLLSEINEKVIYFDNKEEKTYKINSISELEGVLKNGRIMKVILN